MTLDEALAESLALCGTGYRNDTVEEYGRIKELLTPFADGNEKLGRVLNMCDAHENLISKRFAYPHIEGSIKSLLKNLNQD